ncbi:MAG: heavy metal-binding domain-containing protein, partial [Ferruginibacter sp.]
MKKIILIMFLISIYSLASAQEMPGMKMPMKKKETTQQTQKVTYTCPMHPEIHSDKPGNCPKCGMKLVKEKPKQV